MKTPAADVWALGFDIGGTSTKLGLVNPAGEIRHLRQFSTNARGSSPAPFISKLKQNIHEILDQAREEVVGIGMSVHGWTDKSRTGPILCFNTPALHGIHLKEIVETEFHLPTAVNNDLTAHVLAEHTHGSGRDVKRFLCLAVGTGVGAGVIIDGEPLRYTGGCAGDTGHIILEPDGPACPAGCRGCAEALCGVAGIERLARATYGYDVSAYAVIAAAREGTEPQAVAIMSQIGHYLGQLIASLSVIYLPDRIAVTGGTAEAGEPLLLAARNRFEELVGNYHRNYAAMDGDYYGGTEIVLGQMRGETGVVGAVVELLCAL